MIWINCDQNHYVSHEKKNPLTSHYTGCATGVLIYLILAYYNPYLTGQYTVYSKISYTPKKQGLFQLLMLHQEDHAKTAASITHFITDHQRRPRFQQLKENSPVDFLATSHVTEERYQVAEMCAVPTNSLYFCQCWCTKMGWSLLKGQQKSIKISPPSLLLVSYTGVEKKNTLRCGDEILLLSSQPSAWPCGMNTHGHVSKHFAHLCSDKFLTGSITRKFASSFFPKFSSRSRQFGHVHSCFPTPVGTSQCWFFAQWTTAWLRNCMAFCNVRSPWL